MKKIAMVTVILISCLALFAGCPNTPTAPSASFTASARGLSCTFTANTVSGAYACGGGVCNSSQSLPTATTCILWGNLASISANEIYNKSSDSVPSVTYSCVEGGYDGTGNIASDPLFVDAANGDYRLQSTSLCIDTGISAGAPATDILGVPRPQGSGYDMGAYEYAP